ncbi:MAG: FliG C-terminal domain-containing protein [Thermoguttaceae bacterium]
MDVATNDYDAGIRKAAVLVASLGDAVADLLLDELAPEQAEAVRQAAAALDEIGDEERQRVLDEFCRIRPMVPKGSQAGIELSSLPVARSSLHGGSEAFRSGLTPFEFLQDADEMRVAQLLADERPATVALVLSQLPPECGGEVLARLAPSLQMEVVRRLVSLEDTDPETLHQVERALESRLSRQLEAERRRAAGPESAARILAACNGPVRGRILDSLAAEDRRLAERLGHATIDFDDLVRCDDATLRTAITAAGPELVQAALLGAAPKVAAKLLGCLPRKEAKCLRRKLAHPDPIRLSEVEEARQQIAALVVRRQADIQRPRIAA